ncbi:DUF1707 domain-containing protein [Streptomyces sp. MBT65]|nr:DUF1707 domain-containing protein [Streptomyces sp. MBT65]
MTSSFEFHTYPARLSDAERDKALKVLHDGVAMGRLSHDTFIRRMELALAARRSEELVPLTADLPTESRLSRVLFGTVEAVSGFTVRLRRAWQAERLPAALVARRPQDARLRRVGTSRAGTPLWLLSVGHGSRQVLVVAGPHANEPVGGATVLRLAERALADPRLSEDADATWNLLLCLDPDGSRRNEGWLPGPYSLGRYFRNFFRPGFLEQPEWLPHGAAGARLPETRALLEVQDELRPFLQCSLHGVDVGGGFVELTRDLPGLARRVAHTATRLGIPRELGPYDTLYWPNLGPAVYRIPPPRPGDLAAAITEAAVESTWYHPHRHGTVTAVVEAPMWGVAGVENGQPPTDADAFLRTVSHTLRHDSRVLEQLLARIRPFVQGGTEAGTGLGLIEYQSRVVLSAFELARRHAPVRSRSGEPGWGTETVVPMHRE